MKRATNKVLRRARRSTQCLFGLLQHTEEYPDDYETNKKNDFCFVYLARILPERFVSSLCHL